MSYDLKIFRNEVRAKNKTLDFLSSESSALNFSVQQVELLKRRLIHYKYEIESETESSQTYKYDGGKFGITAILVQNCLTFRCAGGDQNGLFEILQTSSELCDGDLSVLNLQEGTWEGEFETEEIVLSKETQTKDEEAFYISFENAPKIVKPWWKFW